MLKRRAALTIALTLAVALTACAQNDPDEPEATRSASATESPSPTPTPSPSPDVEVEAGWALHEEDGFSIALPEEWQVFDAETIAETGIFEELADENPDLASVFAQVQAAIESGQTTFIAMELGAPAADGFAENVNIGESAYRGSLSDLEELSVAEIEAGIPVSGEVESEVVDLRAHEAVRLQYGYSLDTADQTLAVEVIQYLVVEEDSAWIITFSSTADQMPEYEATFEESADSFTIED